jgi:acetyl-CoA decarbonylase/synthase complex subunit delta
LWELTTALTLLLAGVDLFMMMHPAAVKAVKDTIKQLTNGGAVSINQVAEWVSAKT